MFKGKKLLTLLSHVVIFAFIISIVGTLGFSPSVQAQAYWTNLAPYNLLWPLWSPPLSPLDPVTKLQAPIITSLSRDTILPVQPGLCWDPIAFPKGPVWLLYNTPPAFGGGLLYWNSTYGINPFPPSYLSTPSGYPIPIALAEPSTRGQCRGDESMQWRPPSRRAIAQQLE